MWPLVTLRDVSTADGQYGVALSAREWRPGDPRYVRITDITDSGRLGSNRVAPDGTPDEWQRAVLTKGDLVFARSGATVGKTYLYPGSTEPAVFAGYLIKFDLDERKILPQYAFRYTQSPQYRAWVASAQRAVAQPNINAKQFAELPIPLPPLDEQRRIAAILGHIDALRVKRSQALALLDELSRSTYRAMFEEQNGLPCTLGDIAEVVTGYAFKSTEYTTDEDAVKLCRGANVLPGRLDWSDLARWPRSRAAEFSKFDLSVGDIVMALDRPWISEGFKIARVGVNDCPAILVQGVARIRANEESHSEFIYQSLNSQDFERHCRPTETTIPHISPNELRSYSVDMPQPVALKQFSLRAQQLSRLKEAQLAMLAEFDSLLASLQSRAFSGQL